MKQVAGTLKLDLAQYRELAAFAQFGSDLDKATQAQLDRGIRLVEILNQPQFSPMSLAKEVVILYAGTRGFLDKYAVDKIKSYEPQLLSFVEGKYPEIMKEIDEKQIIGPELDKKLREVLAAFDSVYVAE
jgi:F-type H+-transporting ATPase subunit alpha